MAEVVAEPHSAKTSQLIPNAIHMQTNNLTVDENQRRANQIRSNFTSRERGSRRQDYNTSIYVQDSSQVQKSQDNRAFQKGHRGGGGGAGNLTQRLFYKRKSQSRGGKAQHQRRGLTAFDTHDQTTSRKMQEQQSMLTATTQKTTTTGGQMTCNPGMGQAITSGQEVFKAKRMTQAHIHNHFDTALVPQPMFDTPLGQEQFLHQRNRLRSRDNSRTQRNAQRLITTAQQDDAKRVQSQYRFKRRTRNSVISQTADFAEEFTITTGSAKRNNKTLLSLGNRTQGQFSNFNERKSSVKSRGGAVFERLYQACQATNMGNHEAFLHGLKSGTNHSAQQKSNNEHNYYRDSSMFTASLKRVRMIAKIERLKEKEMKVIKERKLMLQKQQVIKEIQSMQKSFRVNIDKLIVMPISDLLKKKHLVLVHARQVEAAKRLQKWWRNRLLNKRRGFAPIGIWEVKKMLDKVVLIQSWYRKILDSRVEASRFRRETKAVILVQRFTRRLLERHHQRKLIKMEESFQFFNGLRVNMETDSQIKIAHAWRRHIRRKRAKEEKEREEQERKRKSDLRKQKAAKGNNFGGRHNNSNTKYQSRTGANQQASRRDGPSNNNRDLESNATLLVKGEKTSQTDIATLITQENRRQSEMPVTSPNSNEVAAAATRSKTGAKLRTANSFAHKPLQAISVANTTTDQQSDTQSSAAFDRTFGSKAPKNDEQLIGLNFSRAQSEQPSTLTQGSARPVPQRRMSNDLSKGTESPKTPNHQQHFLAGFNASHEKQLELVPENESALSVEEEEKKAIVSQSEFKLESTKEDIFVEAAVNSAESLDVVNRQKTANFGVNSNSQQVSQAVIQRVGTGLENELGQGVPVQASSQAVIDNGALNNSSVAGQAD